MALSNIALTAGMRANLSSLQNTSKLFDTTQTRLASGKKVNTALDDPIAYFAAKGYMDRANDLSGLKDSMNEAIQTVKAADAGITAIIDLIAQAKSIANSALATTSTTERSSYAAQFDSLRGQITDLAEDAGYKGVNLLQNGNLTVYFNESSTNSLSITGFSADAAGLSVAVSAGNWAADANVNTAITNLNTASATLRTQSKSLSNNLAVVNTRLEFTANMINTLTGGADKLTLADMNEEGANLLMLQTRQALSTTSLSLSSQAAQSVLRLF
jgi:flagellin-like hook-associated protein FlgL